MKTVQELSNELIAIQDSTINFVKTEQVPDPKIVEVYQYVVDLFAFLLDERIVRLKLLDENKPKESFGPNNITISDLPFPTSDSSSSIGNIESLKKRLNEYIVVGGGCLSEQFISNYNKPFKDVDVFVSSELLNYIQLTVDADSDIMPIEDLQKHFFQELNVHMKNGDFTEDRPMVFSDTQFNALYAESRDISSVYEFLFNGLNVDLIFTNNMNLDFDFSFRQFFFNGSTIYAKENAMVDIKNNEITVSSLTTPISSYVRLLEFEKRYDLKVDDFSRTLLEKTILYKVENDKDFDLKSAFKNLKKYDSSDVYQIFCERTKNTVLTPFQRKFFSSNIGCSDKISLFRNRVKHLFELDTQGEEIPLSIPLSYSLGDVFGETLLPSSIDEVAFENFISSRLKKLQLKKLFSSNHNSDVINFYQELNLFLGKPYQYDFDHFTKINPIMFDVHRYIEKELRNSIPGYTALDFYNASLLESKDESDALFCLLNSKPVVADFSVHCYLYPSYSNELSVTTDGVPLATFRFRNTPIEHDNDDHEFHSMDLVFTDKLNFQVWDTRYSLIGSKELTHFEKELGKQWNTFTYALGTEPSIINSQFVASTSPMPYREKFVNALDSIKRKYQEIEQEAYKGLHKDTTLIF